jgi:hypothetical protein
MLIQPRGLHQEPSAFQFVVIVLVVLAGVVAQRDGQRHRSPEQPGSPADLDAIR